MDENAKEMNKEIFDSEGALPDSGSGEGSELKEQFAPEPASRVITPSEVAIAYASGAPVPVPAPSFTGDPGITEEFPALATEEIQMPEVIAASEFSEPEEQIASQEVSDQLQDATLAWEDEPAMKAPTAYVAEEVSPVPLAIDDEAAQAVVQEVNEQNIAIAASEMLAAEQAYSMPMAEEPLEVEEEPAERGITVITKEATVLGDILTEGHIDVVGRVKGNIDAKGDVAIHGIVRGDVGGAKIGLYNCRVKGNLDAGLGVIVDDSSVIGGDVRTKNIIFDGKVKGNIDAENVVVLRSHSYCLGDVTAASLAIEPGAILNGKVKTFVEGDLEAPFYEVI
ncbi:MAG: polymer-forming cytoskeletal protein [Coriobacteriia bacterium]|nr:polymer-forming cytoskeletal protein [Coriobacteriia bacterium]